jgi:hypothetical protein
MTVRSPADGDLPARLAVARAFCSVHRSSAAAADERSGLGRWEKHHARKEEKAYTGKNQTNDASDRWCKRSLIHLIRCLSICYPDNRNEKKPRPILIKKLEVK